MRVFCLGKHSAQFHMSKSHISKKKKKHPGGTSPWSVVYDFRPILTSPFFLSLLRPARLNEPASSDRPSNLELFLSFSPVDSVASVLCT